MTYLHTEFRVVRALKRDNYAGYIGLDYVPMDTEIAPGVDNGWHRRLGNA